MGESISKSYAIVGAGAIGLYYGGRLAAAGEDVRFLLRSDFEGIRDAGLTVESIDGDFRVEKPQIYRDTADIGPVDVVVVSWKTTANENLKEVLGPLLHEGTVILTLQNGLGNTELLAQLFGASRVLGGLCFVCINRLAPGLVKHTGGGMVTLGDFGDAQGELLKGLVATFQKAGIVTKGVENLGQAQWVKLVWNVPFNGLCITEGGIDTKELLRREGGAEGVRELMGEVLAGAAALGFEVPESVAEEQLTRTYPMGPYRPSSMIDFVEGREVEVESIWAEPLRRAEAAGAELPAWRRLLEGIRVAMAERRDE